jgi:hypothetical protein
VRAHRRQKRRQRNMQIMRAALPYIAHAPSSFICTGSHSLCVPVAESSLSAKFCSLCVYVYVFIFPLLAHIRHYFCTSEVYLKKKCHSYPSYYHSLFVFPYCERESALKWRRRQMDEREWERPQLSHYMCARAENSFGHDGENNNKFVLQRVKNTLCVCVRERESEWASECCTRSCSNNLEAYYLFSSFYSNQPARYKSCISHSPYPLLSALALTSSLHSADAPARDGEAFFFGVPAGRPTIEMKINWSSRGVWILSKKAADD